MYIDKRKLYLILGIIGAIYLIYLIATGGIVSILCLIPGLLLAITIHEFGHAISAYMLGDDTAKRQGRLSLNPFEHIDFLGLVSMLLFRFGWGKPVQINPNNFKKKISLEKGEAIVALAGPLFNFITAFILILIYRSFKFIPTFATTSNGIILLSMLMDAIGINIGLGVFNLIPISPLDGSKIVRPILPNNFKNWLDMNSQIINIIFLILIFTGITGYIISPVVSLTFKGLYGLASLII